MTVAGAPVAERICEALLAERDWMEALLVSLVQAPSELGAEDAAQVVMARALRDCGLTPRDVRLDGEALRRDPASSPFSWSLESKRDVVAHWPAAGIGGRSLILGGHVDVVPPAAAELWTSDPYVARREGDWLYGRGAGDMKAGLVAVCGAVRALRRAGIGLRGDVHLQSVVEEECTGNGALMTLLDGTRADACVIAEPHPDHLTVAQVGVLWFHVDVVGRPAHAAYAETGANALEAATRILTALRELEVELNAEPRPDLYAGIDHPIHLNPGRISGGDWTSTVPAHCTLSCRLAMYPGADPAALQRRVEATVAAACARDGFLRGASVSLRYDGFRCEGAQVDPGEPLVRELSAAYAAVHGAPPDLRATTATTDARHYIRYGIPTVCFGPRAEAIHGIDERVSLSSMHACAEVLARFIVDWCLPVVS